MKRTVTKISRPFAAESTSTCSRGTAWTVTCPGTCISALRVRLGACAGAAGRPLGNDRSGFRVVKVFPEKIETVYYGFDRLPERIDGFPAGN